MEIISTIFIIVIGTLGHFIFEWSGHRKGAGIFFAVNESTWEHIKLAIYPAYLWMIVEIAVRGWSTALITAQFAGVFASVLLIPGIFYGYTAFTKKNWLIADISVFCIAVALSRWVFKLVYDLAPQSAAWLVISIVGLVAILAAYLSWSYHAPHCFLFRDPLNGGFGPTGHDCDGNFHNNPNHDKHHHHHH